MIRAVASRFPETKNRKYTSLFSISLSCLAIKYVVFVRLFERERASGRTGTAEHNGIPFSAITLLGLENNNGRWGITRPSIHRKSVLLRTNISYRLVKGRKCQASVSEPTRIMF